MTAAILASPAAREARLLKRVIAREVPGKGLGVFSLEPIAAGELLEIAPVVLLSRAGDQALKQSDPKAYQYLFKWDEASDDAFSAIAFGYAPFYNHSAEPNLDLSYDDENHALIFTAIKDIPVGVELEFDYAVDLWFDAV
jgi:SET domain-containing protein